MFAIQASGRDALLAMSARQRCPAVSFATIRFIIPPPGNDYPLAEAPHYRNDLLNSER